MTNDMIVERIITQAVWKVWRAQPGTHDSWKEMRPVTKKQIRAVTKNVMEELKPYLDV